MMTVGDPGGRIFPVGLGIGATHDANDTMSPTLPAGRPPIITVVEPIAITPGPPGTHGGIMHGCVMLPTTAAGVLSMSTVIAQLPTIAKGIGGCGIGVGTGAGGWIGAWQCGASCSVWSPMRAAGGTSVRSVEVDALALNANVHGGLDAYVSGSIDVECLALDVNRFTRFERNTARLDLHDDTVFGHLQSQLQAA